jgi:hypothetical protein
MRTIGSERKSLRVDEVKKQHLGIVKLVEI